MEDEKNFELAQKLAEAQVEAGRRAVAAALPKQPEDFDGCCVSCGDDLPEERIEFGAITCVPCQVRIERRQALTRRT